MSRRKHVSERLAGSRLVSPISPQVKGVLEYLDDTEVTLEFYSNPFHQEVSMVSQEPGIRRETSASFASQIIEDLDSSRDYCGNNNWKGEVEDLENEILIDLSAQYSEANEIEELPPRSSFLEQENYSEDPYEILEGPVELRLMFETDMYESNASELLSSKKL